MKIRVGTKHFLRNGGGYHVPKNKRWLARRSCRKSKSQKIRGEDE